MPGKLISFLTAFLLLALLDSANTGNPVTVQDIFLKADQFFNSATHSNETDSLALAGFNNVIAKLEKYPDRHLDSFLFQAYLRKGILLDAKAKNAEAKNTYLKAAAMPRKNALLSDSLLFRVYIYVGSNYFNLNHFDSANYFLVKAENLTHRFPRVPEKEKLYNTLGALNYVNGNYLQSRKYFNQALELIQHKPSIDTAFALGLQVNIATSSYKSGRFAEALTMYNTIVKEKIPAGYIYNSIYTNMGKTYLAIKKYPEALASFKKVDYCEMPGVLNEKALAHFEMKHIDSAAWYLDQLQLLSKTQPINILDVGINDLYRAGLLSNDGHYLSALSRLQNVINIFSANFNNLDIYSNPTVFSGSLSYYRLFDALYKKAKIFELLNKKSSSEKYLAASLDAYRSALTLLSFIEKSYDTDDAKFFLKKNSREIYVDALNVCLNLHQSHPGDGYLEQAFMISEKNKASLMTANLQQREILNLPGIDQTFIQKERNIKYNIARLDVKSEQARDDKEIKKLAVEKAKYEIELSDLQKSLEKDNRYFQLKYDDGYHDSKELNKNIEANQALFSFYMTNESLHVFAFSNSSFKYTKIDSVAILKKETDDWVNLLRNSNDGRKFDGSVAGQRLYQHLIKPLQELVPGKNEWIIIPDGNLHILPFESLPDGITGKTMLETTTISYQFSSRFIVNPPIADSRESDYKVLSFAPFVRKGNDFHQPGIDAMDRLPGSGEEIEDLSGISFKDGDATKSIFLQEQNHYPIIHLATHAVAEMQNPASSFIAFYPKKNSPAEDCLYLDEIYGLHLDNCKLVIISACETGKGELVNNEGIISLGRAFAYAGCASTINSLWKADDKATSAILKKFHEYLQDGFSKSKALQKAKLDFINSDALYKNPAYWSNLILTGSIEPVIKNEPSLLKWTTVTFFLTGILLLGSLVSRKRKKSQRFLQIPQVKYDSL